MHDQVKRCDLALRQMKRVHGRKTAENKMPPFDENTSQNDSQS